MASQHLGFRVKAIILMLLVITGFVWVTAYFSLHQSTDQMKRLSDQDLPSLASTMTLSNILQEVIQSSGRLMNARVQAERRLTYKATADSLREGRKFIGGDQIVGAQKDLETILATLSTTATDLNALINEKLETAALFETQIQEFNRGAQRSVIGLGQTNPATADWYAREVAIIFRATALSTNTEPKFLRREVTQINRALQQLARKADGLSGEGKIIAQRAVADLSKDLQGNNGIFAILRRHSQLQLRANAVARQMRLITSELVRELDALTTGEIELAQQSTNMLAQRSNANARWLVLAVLGAGIITLASFLYIDRMLVRRLMGLKTAVNERANGAAVPIPVSGKDEISEISAAVAFFVEEIDNRQRDLMASADQIRAIILESPLPMCIATGRDVLFHNEAFAELVRDREEARHLLPLLPPPILAPGQETAAMNRQELKIDGTSRWFDLTSSPATWEGVAARQLILVDVSDQVMVEKTLSLAKEKAEAAAQAKSSFLAMMSHEIRSPMNGIISVAELLSQGRLSKEQQQLVGVINQSAETLLTVINDILDFSKIEAGKLAISPFDFELPNILRGPVDLLASEFEQKGLKISVEIDETVPKRLHGDGNRIRQILFNLLSNAAKFTSEGSVKVTASLIEAEEDEPVIAIAVSDSGIGISQDSIERLFQPFEQADSSTARQFGGTGLGLSICKKLAEIMGGTLAVESKLGIGSTFTLTIPCTPAKAKAAPPQQIRHNLKPDTSQAARHILVVEDNPINQMVIGKVLDQLSCRFDVAEDGEVALAMLQDGTDYDLILTDLRMPRMDGFALAKAVRKHENGEAARMPIVAVSADAMEETRIQSTQSGIDAFITKPIKIEEIRDCLETYVPRASIAAPVS